MTGQDGMKPIGEEEVEEQGGVADVKEGSPALVQNLCGSNPSESPM